MVRYKLDSTFRFRMLHREYRGSLLFALVLFLLREMHLLDLGVEVCLHGSNINGESRQK